MTSQPRRTLSQSLEALLCAATVPSTRTVAVGSLLATVSSLAPGCDPAAPVVDSLEQGVIAYGQADWVQRSGIRDTAQVQYYKEYWRDLSTCNSRFGCRSMTVFIKLRVKPVSGADLSKKRVGVEWHNPGVPSRTAVGAARSQAAGVIDRRHGVGRVEVG